MFLVVKKKIIEKFHKHYQNIFILCVFPHQSLNAGDEINDFLSFRASLRG